MNGVPRNFNFNKTLNEQLNTFEYYKNRYCAYELEIVRLHTEIKELKARIDKYENPDDLTLMFMYCDEKAKDKIKELKEENEELKQRFYKAIHEIQLIQMDGEVSVRDITELVETLKGDK